MQISVLFLFVAIKGILSWSGLPRKDKYHNFRRNSHEIHNDQHRLTSIKIWISNKNILKKRDVSIRPYPEFNGCLPKFPFRVGHGWFIISHLNGCNELIMLSPDTGQANVSERGLDVFTTKPGDNVRTIMLKTDCATSYSAKRAIMLINGVWIEHQWNHAFCNLNISILLNMQICWYGSQSSTRKCLYDLRHPSQCRGLIDYANIFRWILK